MASSAQSSQGVSIGRGDGASSESFVKIGEVTSFSGLGGSASEIDVTSVDSTSREFLMGLEDGGDFSIEVNLVPGDTAQGGLWTDYQGQTLRNFEVELNDAVTTKGTTYSFSAYVKSFSISGGTDDKISASIVLRITGDVTKTAAT